ncbi:NADH-quinone oxidoreductase subunit NuoE [Xanthobacter sp. KR7-225]|uniref:NADH-quinone oxidoreductase subunit NuoE n=1 Tax=Xanthobacter sp. KR7-225 TaxID=3156613 RepID=UPI0032B4FA43
MSVRRLAAEQPDSFVFTPELEEIAAQLIAKYPEGRQASAVVPLLWETQKAAGGWLPEPAIRAVADRLGMGHIRVLEIVTFYTMFNLAPVGKYFVQLCGTTPCMLRGAEDIKRVCEKKIGHERQVTADGTFSWLEVECLGACTNAPMVQINDDYYEDLTPETFEKLLDDLAAGRPVKVGPQNSRHGAEPEGGARVLTDAALYAFATTVPGADATGTETPDLLSAGRARAAEASPADPLGATAAAQEKAADGADTRDKREAVAAEAQASSPSVTGSDREPVKTGTGVRDPEE